MHIFVFESDTHKGLRAFAGDKLGRRLPQRIGLWRLLYASPPDASLPHGIQRRPIERAILSEGFQMWRRSCAVKIPPKSKLEVV